MQEVKDLAIWVNGNNKPYCGGKTRFLELVDSKLATKKREASSIQNNIERHHTKTIKGNNYWYAWEGDRWVSKGPASKGDPRKVLEAAREKLLAEIETLEEKMVSCVVKESGDHLVFSVGLFKKYIGAQMPSGVILVSELLNRKAKT